MILLYAILVMMTVLGSIASFFLKKASSANGIKELVFSIYLYIGGLLYLSSAVLNVYLLKYLDYSVVLPLTSFTYIWTMVFSHMIFKEKISARKIVGVCLIVVGAVAISCG